MSGSARDIGIGSDGTVWVVGYDSGQAGTGYAVYKWDGAQFNVYNASEGALRIAGAPGGAVGSVDAYSAIHVR